MCKGVLYIFLYASQIHDAYTAKSLIMGALFIEYLLSQWERKLTQYFLYPFQSRVKKVV